MSFWNQLKTRLSKFANLDEHAAGLKQHGLGSQIMVPNVLNDGSPVSSDYHKNVKNKIESMGMTHAHSPATGGWVSDEHGLMIEPMTAHRAYGAAPKNHMDARQSLLPAINRDLKQEASLASYRGPLNSESENITPFSMHSLHARMPINLDPANKNNTSYRNMLSQLAASHGGFTHYQTPTGNQLEILGHNSEELKFSQNTIADYLKQHHGVEGDFQMPQVNGYLHFGSDPLSKTAAPGQKTADVRNAIHELNKGAKRGDQNILMYLQHQNLT